MNIVIYKGYTLKVLDIKNAVVYCEQRKKYIGCNYQAYEYDLGNGNNGIDTIDNIKILIRTLKKKQIKCKTCGK